MKTTVLLLSTFFVGLISFSQEARQENYQVPTNYQDSLSLAFEMIDDLDMSNLTKQKERFTYKVRIESYQLNVQILAYIEERIKTLSK